MTSAVAPVAFSQQSIDYGSISGRVMDGQGAVIRGAEVSARQTETNITVATSSDEIGRFRFPYLKVGRYELIVRMAGFAEASRSIKVTVGAAFDIPVTLTVADVESSLTVSSDEVTLETARTQIAGTVPEGEIRALPMNGRNFLDLALLVPGVAPANIGSTQLFAETSAVPGQGISVASQRNLSNNFIVDGVSANDDAAGLSGIPLGVDSIDQFQVVTSGAQAELGRALGGYISVVTKSGTNSTTGGAYEFLRDDSLNAVNVLSGKKLPMNQHQFGASIGGPLRRDRSFYFSNIEQRLLDQSGLTTIAPENVASINDRLAATEYPGPAVTTGTYPNPVHSTTLLAKLDHHVNGRDQLSVRYSFYRVNSENSRGAGGLNAPTASAALHDIDHSIAVGNTWSISSKTVNETRAQFAYGDLNAPPSDPVGPAVAIAGVATFGTLSGGPVRRTNTMVELVDALSHAAGAHALRAGADMIVNDDTITFPRAVRGSYSFSSLASFLTGNYSGFTQTFGDPRVKQHNPNVGIFLQDEWRIAPAVTLNAGIRYDLQFLETVRTDANNLSPRVGMVWAPSGARRYVMRGSTGLFFDRVPLRAVANAILSAGNTTDPGSLHQPSVSGLLPTQTGAPTFPNILPARVLTSTLVDFTRIDPHVQNAYSKQASVEIERATGATGTVSVGYQYLGGNHLLMSVNQNVATCVAVGQNNGCRPDAAYRNDNQYSAVGRSTYHGVHFTLVQRATRWSSVRLSYTLSKSMNDVGEAFFSSPIDSTNVMRDWGRSDDDQRHRVVAAGTLNAPLAPASTTWERVTHGFQLSGSVQYYSALPLNVVSGVTSLQGTAGRPLADGTASSANFDIRTANVIARNAAAGSDFLTLNVRVNRTFRLSGFKLEAMVEGFNVTNHVNAVTRNANFGPGAYPTNPLPAFGQISAVSDPRAFQIGARLTF